MKYIALIALVALTACVEEGSDQTGDMTTMCLDHVAYWLDGQGQSQMMAVRIDPKTLQPMLCK
jgi:hypothetical protein